MPAFGTPIINNPSFATPSLGTGSVNDYVYNPTGASWTFTGNSGIAAVTSYFDADATPPNGTQFAFMQQTGEFSQTVTGLTVGASYTLSFFDCGRFDGNTYYTIGSFGVTMGSSNLGTFTPAGYTFQEVTTGSFTASATSEVLTFQETTAGSDQESLVGTVQINTVGSAPEPGSIVLLLGGIAALGGFGLFARRRCQQLSQADGTVEKRGMRGAEAPVIKPARRMPSCPQEATGIRSTFMPFTRGPVAKYNTETHEGIACHRRSAPLSLRRSD